MKIVYKYYLIVLLFFFTITKPVISQVLFSVDSLHVRDVLWLCQNDVVLSHFAYGPHFDMLFSIINSNNDTVSVNLEKIHVSLKYNYKGDHWEKETITDFKTTDSVVVIYPNSTIRFSGYNFLIMDGEITTGLNYRLVNFLPEIDNLIKHSEVVLEIDGVCKTITSFKNCFTEEHFFIDGTFKESIYDVNH